MTDSSIILIASAGFAAGFIVGAVLTEYLLSKWR